ncbi:MAG: carbohydrate kinase family protein [Cyanobacteria bacterium RUI128]|nr:carbohydrate kinase family protein [Cyanobacteria bacterium RUI128]
MKKIFTIGSATMDVFVECDDANIVSVCAKDRSADFMSYPYGAKIDMSGFSSNLGGGGVNTAMNFANLGYDTSAIFKIGDDIYSEGILKAFENTNVNLDNIIQDKSVSTGFSIILVSFQGDRTVLANRGANALISVDDINFEALKEASFLYIAPLNGESNKVLEPLVNFAHENNIIVCFNAGSTSLKKGYEDIKKILCTSNIVVMNKDEAKMCTNVEVRPDTKTEHYSKEIIHPDVKKMLELLKVAEYQMIVITDGNKGAYAYDGKKYYFCPTYPSEVVSTLGAGDAFASTFCAAMEKTNLDIGKSLMYGSVVSASVISKFGATEGLITFEEVEKRLAAKPEYKYAEV